MEGSDQEITLAKDSVSFYQGCRDLFPVDATLEGGLELIRSKVSDFANVKNVHFLLGAGASSGCIPTMKAMVEDAEKEVDAGGNAKLKELFEKIKNACDENLEAMLGTLYSHIAYLNGVGGGDGESEELIKLIENLIYEKVNVHLDEPAAKENLNIYQRLYQKLSLRNKDLARVNVFTTNYDLLSEKALDYLNINYNNGFGGGLERVFNPARFSYTFSRKIDANLEKYEPLENMVYLYKLHGSLNWVERDVNSFFKILEIPVKNGDKRPEDNLLIYPSPLKQNTSLGAPYSDLIREFQKKLLLPNGVLFVIGYSFSDEHINNIIYQSLASNSSISIVVFGNYPNEPLCKVDDSRVYKIYGVEPGNGGGEKIHYFKYVVDEFIPDMDENREESLLKRFVESLAEAK